ncbi:MAG: phosphotransferase [Anaerolineales bacterium]|nr:phosphotransferase [Anaerolineales bacterium]
MKTISLEQPIAHGRTADIHEWEDGFVLKLFHNWFPMEDIEYEQKIARAVHASGVKSPAAKEIVQVHGRNGLIYERINGETMFATLKRQPRKVFHFGKLLARYHIQMHACDFNADVPVQKQRLQNKIKRADALPAELKPKLLAALETLPVGNKVCHGDFHPDNILMTKNGSVVIDWIDATKGNPLADAARTSVLALGAASTLPTGMKFFIKLFHASYLREYFRTHPNGREEYRQWLPIVAGARLSENIPELENWLIKQAQMGTA